MTANKTYTRWFVAMAIAAISVGALGCQHKSAIVVAQPGAGKPAAVVVVSDRPAEFVPNVLTVRVGDTVEWLNTGGISHSVEFLSDGARRTSLIMKPHESVSYRFIAPGTYPYACRFHIIDGMEGKIVVVGEPDVTKVSAGSH
jgi:plastocyanin